MKKNFTFSKITHGIALTCGMIALSQGLSFARRNPFLEIDRYIDSHANLIAILGLGLFFLSICLADVKIRLLALEKKLGADEKVDTGNSKT